MIVQGKVLVLVVAVAATIGCHVPERGDRHADASAVDAIHDVVVDGAWNPCMEYPSPGDPLCPSSQPYCCPTTLEGPFLCLASPTGPAGIQCREHPVGGLLITCDEANGSGCPTDRPTCCAEHLGTSKFTYCDDHSYQGPEWTCSN